MSDAARLVTADELERFPDDDYKYELVEGRVIRMSPTRAVHGFVVAPLLADMARHAAAHSLGVAFTDVGFRLASDPDTVRAPDVAFIRRERLSAALPRGFWQGPPDLAVEVLSPDDRPGDVRDKVAEYLARGVPLVVVIDPDERTASLFRRSAAPVTIDADGVLDLDEVVSGFRCRLRELFEFCPATSACSLGGSPPDNRRVSRPRARLSEARQMAGSAMFRCATRQTSPASAGPCDRGHRRRHDTEQSLMARPIRPYGGPSRTPATSG
jgi:Uma2 family endonuclease